MPEPPARITTKMASTPNNHLHNHHHHHHNHQPHHHHPSLSSSASNMATTASTSSLLGSSSSKIVIEENGSHSDLLLLPANKPPVNIISVCTGTTTGTTNTPNTAWSCDKPEKGEKFVIPDDVRKVGYMRKWKTNKRKYFVLRLNNNLDLSHATLSYYDSEKKFRANMENTSQVPRRTTLLRQCLAIHRKYDSKHKNVMAVYTKEDMLAAICEEEATLNEWLEAIRTILMLSANIDFAFKSVRDFFSRCEHIWQIQLSRVGLGLSRGILGTHRMCLTGKAILYMVRVDPTLDGPDIHEFPLNSIRRCGHTNSTFFLELGRSSMIGPGELWIQTEDSLMAQHMHECILAAMSSGHHTTHHHTTHHHQSGTSTVVVPREVIFDQTPLPTSSSTSSGHKRSSSGHRPRSSSASNETAKASGQQVVAHIGSNSSISRSNSTRGAKSQCQSMSPTTSPASKDANGNTEPVHGHFVHFSPGPPHYFGHTTVVHCNRNGVIQQSSTSSSQSPSTSRERLCSGSWSRTTSECSNDDGSSSGGCGACSASSSAANTPLGPPGTTTSVFCDCMSASSHQIWSTVAIPCSCYAGAISNFHMDCHSSTNNSTSSSMDCIDSMFVPDHDSFAVAGPSSGMLSLEPPISEEVDGCNSDEYYAMVAQTNTTTTMSTNGKSSSNNSISSMISSKSLTTPCSATVHQLHYVPHHLFCVHMPHLRPTRSNSMSASDRVGGHTGSSTINSPKCHCSGCQNHYNNGGHFTLPTVPAGTDADYLPMSPLGGSSDAIQENESTTASTEQVNATTATSTTPTPKDHHHRESTSSTSSHRGHLHHRARKEEEEEEGYLEMAPLSPTPKASTSSSSMSTASTAPHTTSSEFHLEKVKSYFNADQKTIARHSHHRHHHRQHEDHNHNQTAVICSNQSSLDDSIFNGLTRAYSTGSKPQPLAPSIAAQCTVAPKSTLISTATPNHQPTTSSAAQSSNNSSAAAVTANNLRIRAFSTGSHGINLNALRLNSRRLKKQAQQAQAACATSSTSFDAADCQIVSSSSSSSLAEIEAANCAGLVGQMKNNKASSAPILSPLIQQRTRSATLGARPSSFAYPGQQQQHHHLHHFKLSHPHLVGAHHHGHHHPALVGICCGMPGAAAAVGAGGDQMVITNVGEGDLMEIDYSNNKSRSRSNMFSSGKSEHILSSFEEEMIREAKLRNHPRHRKNSISGVSASSETTFASLKSGGSTSLDGSTAVHHSSSSASVQPPGRKRSDSTSAISNFFGPSRPSGQGGHHSGHHQHHSSSFRSGSTFDHLVASFRHSLNLQPSSPSSSQSSTSQPNQTSVTNSFENKMNNNANQIETEENYFMTGPTNFFTATSKSQEHIVSNNKSRSTELVPSTSSLSTAAKSEQQPVKQSFAASLSSKIRSKSTKVSSNEKLKSVQPVEPTPEPSNEYYTMMGPNSHTAPPPPTVHHISAPKPHEELNLETSEFDQMDLETLSKKLEDRAKQHEANHYRNDSDEEASPYVMMTPLEATNTSGRKSAPSSSSHVQKKQKTSTMRSLISSLGSKSSSSHSADANQASADAPRKKSSTFSGRLRLSRNNSHSANNNNNNNSDAAKRKKNSKSESSGSLVSGNCATDHVTGPTAPTISATPLAS